MRRDTSKTGEPMARYRVRDGPADNAGLINRRNVTVRIYDAALAPAEPIALPEAVNMTATSSSLDSCNDSTLR